MLHDDEMSIAAIDNPRIGFGLKKMILFMYMMSDSKKKYYFPRARNIIEIPTSDRILYICVLDMDFYDICYGLLKWRDSQDIDEYLYDVLQTSYRIIGMDNLKAYLLQHYKVEDFDTSLLK